MISGITFYMLIYTVIADISWFFLGIASIHQQSHHHVSMFAGRTGGDLNHAGRSWRQLASATRPSEHPLNGRTAESWCQEDFEWRFINIPALVRVRYYDHLRALENWCWRIMGECSGQSSSFKQKILKDRWLPGSTVDVGHGVLLIHLKVLQQCHWVIGDIQSFHEILQAQRSFRSHLLAGFWMLLK